ncbi:hypothetical protein ACFQ4L_02140 [Lapidilactobacillus mulanensis]|uniref:Uncharacterized protein n=1 Tax=Lapidilactobacillus mulanensis TaxID=2485999 RepID=A0ABW4DM50_9LACO|nr:hypothetical protein [Lapidilactobacillus mulanensis]
MNFGLLLASGCLIILTCFSGSLTIMNRHQTPLRWQLLGATIGLLIITIICVFLLFSGNMITN